MTFSLHGLEYPCSICQHFTSPWFALMCWWKISLHYEPNPPLSIGVKVRLPISHATPRHIASGHDKVHHKMLVNGQLGNGALRAHFYSARTSIQQWTTWPRYSDSHTLSKIGTTVFYCGLCSISRHEPRQMFSFIVPNRQEQKRFQQNSKLSLVEYPALDQRRPMWEMLSEYVFAAKWTLQRTRNKRFGNPASTSSVHVWLLATLSWSIKKSQLGRTNQSCRGGQDLGESNLIWQSCTRHNSTDFKRPSTWECTPLLWGLWMAKDSAYNLRFIPTLVPIWRLWPLLLGAIKCTPQSCNMLHFVTFKVHLPTAIKLSS